MARSFLCLALLLLTAQGFPISSSKASKKTKVTNDRNKGNGGGGFGAIKHPVAVLHKVDESVSGLIQFLTSFQSEGIGSGSGTEIGSCLETGIRGMYATQSFKKGDILCKIPSDLALALSDPAETSDDVPTLAHSGRNLLNMYVNHPERSITWAPYLESLPTQDNFDPTPDFYSDDELELLEFPRLIEYAKRRKQNIIHVASETDGMSMDDLQFATWLVSSRSFNIQISDSDGETTFDEAGRAIAKTQAKSVCVMVPYLDLVNHNSNSANAEVHIIDPDQDAAWFSLRATRPIVAGKEITICYGSGAESSVELFANYGFVPSENRIDAYMLRKGGQGCLSTDQWTTTLEEDTIMLQGLEHGNLRNILAFRARLKKAYGELNN